MKTTPFRLGGGGAAFLLALTMAFTYNTCDGTNDPIDLVRMLIMDTQVAGHIFEDTEILGAYRINTQQFQSSQFYSGAAGANLPSSPSSVLRTAAMLLDAIANNKARLASIKQLLDVRLDSSDAAIQLRAGAQQLRDLDDNSGAFFIIEQVNDIFSYQQRFWNTVQRGSAV